MASSHHRTRTGRAALVLAAACLAAPAAATADSLELASRADGALGLKGDDASLAPALASEGTRVAFASWAGNLDAADGDAFSDVFLRDLATDETVLVSRADGRSGAKGDLSSGSPSVSADGRRVAFVSEASNLDPADGDRAGDVYVRDLALGTTVLVSRASGAEGAKGAGPSYAPAISADGRHVAFVSTAANLHPDDPDTVADVYVRDLAAGTTTLVSRASGDGPKGDRASAAPAVSGDGTVVAFESVARNLHPGDDDGLAPDVYARDLRSAETALVSRAEGPAGEKVPGGDPSVTSDGRHVAFSSFSASVHPDDRDTSQDVFVRDLLAERTALASRANGPAGADADAHSFDASISATGRFVAFRSAARNLSPADRDSLEDVYVRDLAAGTTTLASRSGDPAATKGDGDSSEPSVAADGLAVAFASEAANLHPQDLDDRSDVFARRVGDARDCDLLRLTLGIGGGDPLSACL